MELLATAKFRIEIHDGVTMIYVGDQLLGLVKNWQVGQEAGAHTLSLTLIAPRIQVETIISENPEIVVKKKVKDEIKS